MSTEQTPPPPYDEAPIPEPATGAEVEDGRPTIVTEPRRPGEGISTGALVGALAVALAPGGGASVSATETVTVTGAAPSPTAP